MLTFSKNNLFFVFLVLGYIFGVMLYDFLDFSYTDELMALFLVFFSGLIVWERKNLRGLKALVIVTGIFFFYLFYSLFIRVNVPRAIFMDFVIQIKPFLAFFATFLLAPRLSKEQKRFITLLTLVCAFLLIITGLTNNIYTVFVHPSRFATAAVVTSLLFFYCSAYSWSDVGVFFIILSIGLLSTRSKFYGFWGVALLVTLYCKLGGSFKLGLKSVLFAVTVVVVTVWLAWDKIVLYYIDGMMNSREMWSRPAMFLTSFRILGDYFPFGCGLGSFGTFASAQYYSPIYAEYEINHLWGLTQQKPSFITDAFYPELAQFGIAGVALYIWFWVYVLKKAVLPLSVARSRQLIVVLIFLFFLIEGIADATFTHNRGMFVLIMLGMCLSDIQDSMKPDTPCAP